MGKSKSTPAVSGRVVMGSQQCLLWNHTLSFHQLL